MEMKLLTTKCIVALFCAVATLAAFVSLSFLTAENNYISSKYYTTANRSLRNILEADVKNNQFQTRKNQDDIRYAAFGSAVTWGAGLEGYRNESTYPKLLSHDASNFAIRSTGPDYPAACTYTFVGDRHFDVIVLEYFMDVKDGLRVLTRRLRERFPDAIIIMLRDWYPITIKNEDGVNVREWAMAKGFDKMCAHDPKFHEEFEKSSDAWAWPDRNEMRIQIQEDVARDYGAHILAMDQPTNAKDWVRYSHLISKDFLHKSDDGHFEVAKRVKDLVLKLGVPEDAKVGEWSLQDSCHSWYDSGIVRGLKLSPNWKLVKFSDRRKYALELHQNHGSITVHNRFEQPTNVYIGYMLISPSPNRYPEVTVKILERNGNTNSQDPIVLDQVPPGNYGKDYVHFNNIKKIGVLEPGLNVIAFTRGDYPETPYYRTEFPFRLIAIAVTNEVLLEATGQPAQIIPKEEFNRTVEKEEDLRATVKVHPVYLKEWTTQKTAYQNDKGMQSYHDIMNDLNYFRILD